LVTSAGDIQAKTDTINWADVTAVKTKTDTIAWGDVTGIKAKTDTITWADVTTAKNNIATLITEVGTGNIAAIKTKTDDIVWADVTGLVTSAGDIQAKTDTINWADVTAVKTKTDTIAWGDVTGIKAKTDTITWADVTTAKNNIATLITEVGTGNIAAIKTKTDDIDWADVTGLVTSAGDILAKTDTINWADVTAVKTKTDTIAWGDVTGIKAKTDTITWADVTTAKNNIATLITEVGTGNIAAIKTKTDDIDWADVTGLVTTSGDIQAKTDTINWADVTAVKTTTDTIAWGDVTGIKTKTDTITWGDVTAIKTQTDKITTDVLVDLGLIKGYTDSAESAIATLDGKVVDVKTVTDATLAMLGTINTDGIASLSGKMDALQADTDTALIDLGIIKGYTDETRTQVTTLDGKVVDVKTVADAIKSQTDNVAAVLANVNIANGKAEEIVGLVNDVLNKWDGYTTQDIMQSFETLGAQSIGSATDATTSNTLFGRLSFLISQFDTVTSSQVSTVQSASASSLQPALAVSTTIAKSALQDVQNSYQEIRSAREMLRASGKSEAARAGMMQAQNSLTGISGTLSKIEAALNNPLYGRILNIAEQVKSTGMVTGGETVNQLFDIPADKANDTQFIQGKLRELKAAAELSKEIAVAQKEASQAPIIKKGW
ncbi:MAG: hypothetical protein V1882_10535, partial [Candidatus Omnitrophota bacterium]